MIDLTDATAALFHTISQDVADYGECAPLDLTPEQKGNLTDLKVKGLVRTEPDVNQYGQPIAWVYLTDAGRALNMEGA